MKILTLFALSGAMLLSTISASAQTNLVYEFPSTAPSVVHNAAPQTVIKVKFTVTKETVRSGPYARYAQRLLGISAPLTDKNTYTIESATLSAVNPSALPAYSRVANTSTQGRPVPVSLTRSDTSFVKVAHDRMQLTAKGQEEMARDAANTIFRLRKQRADLISGDMGENVFGGGLSAALSEINRQENEYLALFLGKHSIQTLTKEHSVVPTGDKFNYVVARFSPSVGLMPESDLSGEPVMLVIKPGIENRSSLEISPKSKAVKFYRIADMSTARVLLGTQELGSEALPIYQYGVTVESTK